MASPDFPLSLYVHVPFCRSKCYYCDFYSVPHRKAPEDEARESRVVDATLREAEHFFASLPVDAVDTIYIGGGTPSMLAWKNLGRLLDAFRELEPAEWTVEANPESVDAGFLETCAEAGVTRLSLGIQSLQDHLLELMGRPGRNADSMRALELIARSWRGDLSLDFLAGIPGQSVREMEGDLSTVARPGLGHVSLYSLTVEPGTELARMIAAGSIAPNPPELDEELWLAGKSRLESLGYVNYEISNFARPGRECRHNFRYWRLEPYLGIGPGAVSTLPAGLVARAVPGPAAGRHEPEGGAGSPSSVVRLSNPDDLDLFLSGAENLWGIKTETVSDSEFLVETLMMGLRTAEGIMASSFHRRFGRGFDELFPGAWDRWEGEGLAVPRSGPDARLRLTGNGRLFLNRLLTRIEDRVAAGGLPALVVTWP